MEYKVSMTIIQSVSRALSILDLFSYARPSLSIAEISRGLGLAKPTTHNLVRTLEAKGYLDQDPQTRRYRLGARLLALGTIMSGTLELNQVASGLVNMVADRTELVCRVGIWDRDAILVTLNAAPKYSEAQAHRIGPRVDAYCSSLGRAILAHLEPEPLADYLAEAVLAPLTAKTITDKDALRAELAETRERGYALNLEEMALGRASLAVPIRGREGQVTASASLTGNPARIVSDDQENLVNELFAMADNIGRRLGHLPGMSGAAEL